MHYKCFFLHKIDFIDFYWKKWKVIVSIFSSWTYNGEKFIIHSIWIFINISSMFLWNELEWENRKIPHHHSSSESIPLIHIHACSFSWLETKLDNIFIFIFRRAVEEGYLDGKRVIQIGLRGSGYSTTDYDWAKQQVNTMD